MYFRKDVLNDAWCHFLRTCRQNGQRMTQKRAAELLGIKQGTLSRFLNPADQQEPSMAFVVCFCALVDLDHREVCPELKDLRWTHG